MGLRALFAQMRLMRHYFIGATLVFAFSIFLGAFNPEPFEAMLKGQAERLGGIAQSLENMKAKQWWFFFYIFINNTVLSILVMYIGAFFAVLPIYFLVTNGLFIGYVVSVSVEQTGWLVLLKGLLPHGIIEIPAILLACAFGMRFGFLAVKGIAQLPSPSRRVKAGEELLAFIRSTIPMTLVLIGMLLVAAVIESTVTYWLMGL